MLAVALGAITVNAQKFALVDMEYILKNIPAFERANEQLNQVSKKYGIRFNCLAPNYVWVPKSAPVWEMYGEHFKEVTPMPYTGMPEDAAWAVVYLCSDEAKYINGVCLPVDGGWYVEK